MKKGILPNTLIVPAKISTPLASIPLLSSAEASTMVPMVEIPVPKPNKIQPVVFCLFALFNKTDELILEIVSGICADTLEKKHETSKKCNNFFISSSYFKKIMGRTLICTVL